MNKKLLCLFGVVSLLAVVGCGDTGETPVDDDDVVGDDDAVETPTDVPDGATDADQDGYDIYEDCNDQDATIHPGALELCDDVDNNCNSQTDEGFSVSTYYPDSDGDNYGDDSQPVNGCSQPEGYILAGGDCNDADATINPRAMELECNGVDENCSGTNDDHPNLDMDGYDICDVGVDGADGNLMDCNDGNANIFPGAPELCDEMDNDCDDAVDEDLELSTYYRDKDADGYGDENDTAEACVAPGGYVDNAGDCNDANPQMFPDAVDQPGDGEDGNCNGLVDQAYTISSGGEAGYEGDEGPLSEATFRAPAGMAIDPQGNIYIADSESHVVRRVSVEGNINTVVGDGTQAPLEDGYGTNVPLDTPTALAYENGILYIADTGHHAIRSWSAKDLLVDTVAGTGEAGYNGDGDYASLTMLNEPRGVAVSSTGTLYIADTGNHVIRWMNLAKSPQEPAPTINIIAGEPENPGYAGDGGAAIEALLHSPTGLTVDRSPNTALYIADSGNNVIRRYQGGSIYLVAGSGTLPAGFEDNFSLYALLDNPTAVIIDRANNIIFCDAGNNRIRMINSLADAVSTIVGSGSDEPSGLLEGNATEIDLISPMGLVFDDEGWLWISDTGQTWIRQVVW